MQIKDIKLKQRGKSGKKVKMERKEVKNQEAFCLCLVFDGSSPCYSLQMWGASVQPLLSCSSMKKGEDKEEEGALQFSSKTSSS